VRAGGTLLTARGQLEIGAVERVNPEQINELKGLGLTESLEIGYRISPRGQALLDVLRAADVGGAEP
jgi:hypothetical protein